MLIGTDCISEGQNLQDCDYVINYDIHWNPVRIIQRFGRIDRIGSTNAQIQLVNFWPDISLDEYINLKERVENRMVIADLAATADDNVLTQESATPPSARSSSASSRTRSSSWRTCAQASRSPTSASTTSAWTCSATSRSTATSPPRPRACTPSSPPQPDKGLRPGVLFALRNVNADETINRGNRLHPHYLVYLDDDGNVIADHTEVKHLLDLIRAGCRAHDEPVGEVYRVFNAATSEGADMGHYSELLTAAIRSMIDVTEERDLDSLFTDGRTTALTQTISGLDDFELIAFLAIVDPGRGSTG